MFWATRREEGHWIRRVSRLVIRASFHDSHSPDRVDMGSSPRRKHIPSFTGARDSPAVKGQLSMLGYALSVWISLPPRMS